MMSIYRVITGKEPATSVGAPKRPNEGIAAGPLIRFLEAACRVQIPGQPDAPVTPPFAPCEREIALSTTHNPSRGISS